MANRAVLVGINRYKMENSDLSGCVNDVTNIRDSLIKFFGFAVDDIRVVTDQRATKKNIMERLQWLVKGAKAGERLLFHFSGHGSQIRDRNGGELSDKLDEILCPHDIAKRMKCPKGRIGVSGNVADHRPVLSVVKKALKTFSATDKTGQLRTKTTTKRIFFVFSNTASKKQKTPSLREFNARSA